MTEKTVEAFVEEISPLTDSITRLVLAPDHYMDYQAGQYLQIVLEDKEFSYSIANAPLGSHKYELHIRHSLDNPYNQSLFASIKKQGTVTLRLPFGRCSLDNLDKTLPIVFLAGGTGFAPVKAMIEQLLASGDPRSFELFWGARTQSDLYMDEKVLSWQSHVERFHYFSLLTGEQKKSLASLVLARHSHDLGSWQIVISGPFDMVYSTRDALVDEGISPARLFSDAFDFESK